MNEESIQVRVGGDSEEASEHEEDETKLEKAEKEEPPLEKMTKPALLEKAKDLETLVEKNFDLYLRAQAEMENLKKRFQKEKQDLVKFSNETLINQLLPVLDNLEKAITHANDGNSLDALKEGVELTLKILKDSLEKAGLKEVKAVGEVFDPNFHQAVCEQEDEHGEAGTVFQEFQKGYLLNDRLIRPAMVSVRKKGAQDGGADQS